MFLEDVFVRPEARGRGVGAALVRAVARAAEEGGCGRMEWMVLKWNKLAIDFYDGLGAWSLDEWQAYRLDGARLRAVSRGERGTT
jgi:GNAT superfamily N-acetyltransferase